jgi:hypothetical protein
VRAPDLASDADLVRRLVAREAAAGERRRSRCVRCRRAIPAGKRRDALYCSERCNRDHRRERVEILRREVRLAVRAAKVVVACHCGEPLDTSVRPGPVPRQCGRCYQREYMRRRRGSR